MDTETHRILSCSKTLTTKQDLKEGILTALKGLDQKLVGKADYLSLSTTLATNACVEGKGGRARLVFIGVREAVVEKMEGTYGLPPVSEICFLKGDPARECSEDNSPDWDAFRRELSERFTDCDSVAVVQINPKYNDGAYEKEAERIIRETLDIPVVCGYDLYQEVNVQKRGATALLNARLLPVMDRFFDSIDRSLAELGLSLPIKVVKSDGSIMSREYAMSRPVETLLCGPAASIIGAMELSSMKDALIVDMGGTTTDVALVRNGNAVTGKGGITIGPWKTMVKGVTIDTFGLGGDSAVELDDNRIYLDQRRIIPLCMAASRYPQVETKLDELVSSGSAYSYPAGQFLLLANAPTDPEKYTPNEQKLIRALQDGPLIFADAAAAVGISPYIFSSRRLENEGVIIRCGVTPTDVMHLYGDFDAYSRRASYLGLLYLHTVMKKPVDEICRTIYDMVKSKLYSNLVRIFFKYETGSDPEEQEGAVLEKLTGELYRKKAAGKEWNFMQPFFQAKIPVIGIGAPTGFFLGDVAEMLQTETDVPPYAMVANAVGAAVGSVISRYTVRIEPCICKMGEGNFRVTGGAKVEYFELYEEAVARGKVLALQRACRKARCQGAAGELKTEVQVHEDHYELAKGGTKLFLCTQIIGIAEML